jgi:hypothetical protein
MRSTPVKSGIMMADESWIALALLHAENPARSDFSIAEIRDRARGESFPNAERPGFNTHLASHLVANKPSHSAAGYRMMFQTGYGRRRLFRDGDSWHSSRSGKIVPHHQDIPEKYHWLLDWYGKWSGGTSNSNGSPAGPSSGPPRTGRFDGLLRLRGTWKSIESPDDFVRRMREDWN